MAALGLGRAVRPLMCCLTLWLAAFASSLAGLPEVAHARSIVVRPDGTGDAPTLQAGVDSLLRPPCDRRPDTLFVARGSYDEIVSMNFNRWQLCHETAIIALDGPGSATVKGFRFNEDPHLRDSAGAPIIVSGLTIVESIRQGFEQRSFSWHECLFVGGFESGVDPSDLIHWSLFTDCTFLGRSRFHGAGTRLERCRFPGETVVFAVGESNFEVIDCVFEGSRDTAAVLNAFSHGSPVFRGCRFAGTGVGLAITPPGRGIGTWTLILDSTFEDITGSGVVMVRSPAECGDPIDFDHSPLSISGSRFIRCGTAVQVISPCATTVTLSQDIVQAARSVAIEVAAASTSISQVIIEDGLADAIRVRHDNPHNRGVSIKASVVRNNRGIGISVVDRSPRVGTSSVTGNTCVLNRGAGISIHAEEAAIENNLVAGNEGSGIERSGSLDPNSSLRYNNSWLNGGADYPAGHLQGGFNLTLDPRFCDVANGDFRVAASSPCALTGPYGQIGALGVGCEASRVALDTHNDHGPHGNVAVAILGHRLFDAASVDPASAMFAGAPARPEPHARLGDVNGDALDDLTLRFDSRRMTTDPGGVARLEAHTLEGAPLYGEVAFKPPGKHNRAIVVEGDNAGISGADPPRLAIHSAMTETRGRILVSFSLANNDAAVIDLVDVAGRLAGFWMLAEAAPGAHRLSIAVPPRSGVYFIRLRQGDTQATLKTVVFH